jgi:aminoglycoside 6'-N-acetyltransferase
METTIDLVGETVRLRTTTAEDAPRLREIRREPRIEAWWDEVEEDFPMDVDDDLTRLTILVEDEVVGMVQFAEEPDSKYRSASLDIFVAPSHQRRGLCGEAIGLVVAYLFGERGHHRLTIDPAAHNEAAIACYSRAGFEIVGRTRLSEREAATGEWHDQLLMELVRSPRGG